MLGQQVPQTLGTPHRRGSGRRLLNCLVRVRTNEGLFYRICGSAAPSPRATLVWCRSSAPVPERWCHWHSAQFTWMTLCGRLASLVRPSGMKSVFNSLRGKPSAIKSKCNSRLSRSDSGPATWNCKALSNHTKPSPGCVSGCERPTGALRRPGQPARADTGLPLADSPCSPHGCDASV